MRHGRLLKIALLGGIVAAGFGQGVLQGNTARAGLEDSYDSLSLEVNEVRAMARATLSAALARHTQAAPVADALYPSFAQGPASSDFSDWTTIPSYYVTAGGAQQPYMSKETTDEAHALYALNKACHEGKPSVVAVRAASAAGSVLKPVGVGFMDWVGKPGARLVAGNVAAYYWADPLVKMAGGLAGAGVGCVAGPAAGAVVSKTIWALNTMASVVPGLAPLRQLGVSHFVFEPAMPHLFTGVKYAARKTPTLFEKLAAHFKKRPVPAAS